MKFLLVVLVGLFIFSSCKKCNLKGTKLLSENFDEQGDWWLISDLSTTAEIFTKIEDGVLKLKTEQGDYNCQRATYFWSQDLSSIKGFELCIRINELILPKDQKMHLYVSLGNWELYSTVEKKDIENKTLVLGLDDKGTHANLRGSLNGKIGRKKKGDDYSTNFFQVSLCPDSTIVSEGEMYLEIDAIEITTL